MKTLATLSFLPSPAGLRAMRLFIKTFADEAGLDFEEAGDLCVAAGEAVNNAIEHGEGGGGPLKVSWREDEDACHLVLADNNPRPAPDPNTRQHPGQAAVEERERGVGLLLMRSLVDEVRVNHPAAGGNEVVLIKRKDSGV